MIKANVIRPLRDELDYPILMNSAGLIVLFTGINTGVVVSDISKRDNKYPVGLYRDDWPSAQSSFYWEVYSGGVALTNETNALKGVRK